MLTATSSIEGLRLAYDRQPDVVILDIRMPGMDGREVCARLRDITDAVILFFTVLSRWTQPIKTRVSPWFAGGCERAFSLRESSLICLGEWVSVDALQGFLNREKGEPAGAKSDDHSQVLDQTLLKNHSPGCWRLLANVAR